MNEQGRKPYETPQLRRCGTLVELTLGGKGNAKDNHGNGSRSSS